MNNHESEVLELKSTVESMRSLNRELTFQAAAEEFMKRNIVFENTQKITLGIMTIDYVYTNLGRLLAF